MVFGDDQLLLDVFQQQLAVGQLGQRVVSGEVAQGVFILFLLADISNDANDIGWCLLVIENHAKIDLYWNGVLIFMLELPF